MNKNSLREKSVWLDNTVPRIHCLSEKTPILEMGCLYMVREAPEDPKTTQAIPIPLEYPSDLDNKTVLLKTLWVQTIQTTTWN